MMTRFRQGLQPSAGFTLTEVVVSVGILGVTIASFFAALAAGFEIVDATRQELRATQILAQKTEAVRLCTWSQVSSLPHTFTDHYYTAANTTNSATIANITYYGTISVGGPSGWIPSTLPYYSNVDLVTVNLTWTNYFGAHAIAHTRSMSTLVAYYGLVNYIAGANFVQR